MGLHRFAAVVAVVLVSCLLAPPAIQASSLNISTYWGTSNSEGSLIDACDSQWDNIHLYNIVNIGFVDKFGSQHTPTLNIRHCDPLHDGCKYLGAEIKSCQNMGIKVLISIGGPGGDYNLTSADNAMEVAEYLWYHYLGGRQSGVDRPFGDDATLDGVDFFIEAGTTQYWDVLAEALRILSNINNGTQMELSATPKCKYPDYYLGAAIQANLFDYVQVRFYNETGCQYNGSFESMKSAWDEWTAKAPEDKIFAGVTAFKDEEGYVDPSALFSGFLEYAMESSKFGGMMVWDVYSDHYSSYSKTLKSIDSAIQSTTPSGVEVE